MKEYEGNMSQIFRTNIAEYNIITLIKELLKCLTIENYCIMYT